MATAGTKYKQFGDIFYDVRHSSFYSRLAISKAVSVPKKVSHLEQIPAYRSLFNSHFGEINTVLLNKKFRLRASCLSRVDRI